MWEAWVVAGLLVLMVGLLTTGRFGADVLMMGVLLVLLLCGILTPDQALGGFASQGLATVAFLYIVAVGVSETGVMALVTSKLIGRPKSTVEAQTRLVLPVAGLSAFINNTPIVSMFLPVLGGVARRSNLPASKLFMPLSFASILGGMCTLMGTSTNVIIAGLLADHDDAPQLGMFTLAWVGVPIAIVGLVYILVFGRKLLPDHGPGTDVSEEEARRYMTALRVGSGSSVAGKTVEAAGLRQLSGLFLIRIERERETVTAVAPHHVIERGDELVFVGRLDSVVDLQKTKGLVPIADHDGETATDSDVRRAPANGGCKLIEAVVSASSPLVGLTVRDAGIRTRYDAVVIAVHRHGHHLKGKIGDIRLQPGDTLLLEAPEGFAERHRDSAHFHLVSELEGSATHRHERASIAIAIVFGLVVLVTLQIVPLVVAAMAAAGAMVVTRCCTGPQARAGINWTVLVVIGCAMGFGEAMRTTGLAEQIAHGMVSIGADIGPWALLALVYVVTVVLTAFLSNNAAAVLMFPIAMAVVAEIPGLNILPFAVVICIAASAEFSTPIGYQTNLMVMGPGRYRWLDYTRFGGPLTVLCGVLCIVLTPMMFPLSQKIDDAPTPVVTASEVEPVLAL